MRSVYPIIAVTLTGAGVAVAQNPLNGFISQAVSLASQLGPTDVPSSQPSQTSSGASRTSLSGSQASSAASAASAASVASSQSLALFNPPPTPTTAAQSTSSASGAAASQTAAPASNDNGGGGLSARDKGIIAGCVVGGVLLLAALAALLCCCCLRRRRRRRREKKDWEKRGLQDSHEAIHGHREAYETHGRRHGNFSTVMATPRQSSSALPRHSGTSDRGLVAGPPYGHHNHPMPAGNGLGTASGGVLAAAAVPRHSGAHDRPSRNPFAGFAGKHHGHHDRHEPYDYPDHRMSGGSAPLLGNDDHPAYRNSAGSHSAGAGIHDPGSPVSMGNGVKRRPLPDESHDHHGAALGAGAVGAMAGAAAYKHHHDKKRGSGVSNGDYIEDNNRYSTGSASSGALRRSQEAHRSQEVPPPMPAHQHDASRFPPLLPAHHDTYQPMAAHSMPAYHDTHQPTVAQPMAAYHDTHQPTVAQPMAAYHDTHQPSAAQPIHDDEYRPPTPFGLAALGSHSPHRTSHGSPPTYPDPPFAATRRSGSFPDPTISDHSQHYPGHHVAGDPRRSSHGSSGPLAAGAAGAAAGVAAGAIGSNHHHNQHHQEQQQQHPFRRSNGSLPEPPVDDHTRTYPYHHTAAPPTKEQRRSLQDRELVSGHNSSGEHIAYEPTDHHGRSKRHSMPDTYDRSRSNSAPRVPPAAIGAVGRDSPRVTATESPPFNGHNGHGGSDHDLHRLSAPIPRPQYPGQPSYSSYYSDAPTPGDDIPGAFPHDDRPSRPPVGHGMREHRRSEGDSPARSSGRRLRFSDRHEEWEFADGDRPQDASVGRAY